MVVANVRVDLMVVVQDLDGGVSKTTTGGGGGGAVETPSSMQLLHLFQYTLQTHDHHLLAPPLVSRWIGGLNGFESLALVRKVIVCFCLRESERQGEIMGTSKALVVTGVKVAKGGGQLVKEGGEKLKVVSGAPQVVVKSSGPRRLQVVEDGVGRLALGGEYSGGEGIANYLRYDIAMRFLEFVYCYPSLSSSRKRKALELEPEVRIAGLECNRSLLEGILFVNNKVIETPEHVIFFIDAFGDQAF
ncbi:hypothetical protein Tco_0655771 [Tanacetum coccineum]|uniref:Uncharacterized protein n=1 Tax=Tanacetum coccineum TaxID=301880 RepID=A0ABQ4X843_9ASTR